MYEKIVFQTHIDSKGKLKAAKEQFDCPKCNGECYIVHESVSPSGSSQTIEYKCTDCFEAWTEVY